MAAVTEISISIRTHYGQDDDDIGAVNCWWVIECDCWCDTHDGDIDDDDIDVDNDDEEWW